MCHTTTEDITNKIILESAKTIEMFGLSPLESRLFVFLYLQDEPKTLDDMSEALGKSKTSMSTSIRSLADAGLVTLVWKKGVRKDLYAANDQLFKTFMNKYVSKWIDTSHHQKDALEKIHEDLESQEIKRPRETLHNLEKIIEFHKQIETSFRHLQ